MTDGSFLCLINNLVKYFEALLLQTQEFYVHYIVALDLSMYML